MKKNSIKDSIVTFKNKKYEELTVNNKKNKFITFRFLLPFRIPVENGTYFIYHLSNGKEIMINFYHKVFESPTTLTKNKKAYTYVEFTELITKKKSEKLRLIKVKKDYIISEVLSELFDNYLEHINKFINIILLKYQFHNIYTIAAIDILDVPIYMVYNSKGEVEGESVFLLRSNSKIEIDQENTLSKPQIRNIVSNYQLFLNHPAEKYTLMMRKSERAYYQGDYNLSIILKQTSLEIFLAEFVKEYKRKVDKIEEKKINNILSESFVNIVNQHFIPSVKRLDFYCKEEIEKCSYLYMKTYYPMRKVVVHEGGDISKNEVENYTVIIEDLIRMIVASVHKAKENEFIDYFKKYNIINSNIDIEKIKKKYSID